MAEIQFRYFGWNNTQGHDKIWGWFTIDDKVYNFWGPRGEKKLVSVRFKAINDSKDFTANEWTAKDKQREKSRKDYKSVPVTVADDILVEVEKIYPGFTSHLKKSMFIAKLSGTIKGAE